MFSTVDRKPLVFNPWSETRPAAARQATGPADRRGGVQIACVLVPIASVLLDRLHSAGLTDVTAVEPVEGGMAALAGIAAQRSGPPLFVKSFADLPADDLFAASPPRTVGPR
jgi:hypothetical protein